MFVDKAIVDVSGGDGGDGMVAFRREKYVPLGGPAGGDGGRGGNVVFVVNEGLRTLLDFRYQRHLRGARGDHGRAKNQHGANAEDLYVKVPPGTIVRDLHSGVVIADLTEHGQQAVIARGGKGGRGNVRFANAKNKAPDMAERGDPGETRTVQLELRVIADAGLVGFPSVGKSTLLSVVSAARPKIAAYHFTTLSPNLGVVGLPDDRSFVLADLPGLIEGAHEGQGLGHDFLRHISRTRVLIHVIDMGSAEERDPREDYRTIRKELEAYNETLAKRPQIVCANKMDLPDAAQNLETFCKEFPALQVVPVSAVTREGIDVLMWRVAEMIESTPLEHEEADVVANADDVVYRGKSSGIRFSIARDNDTYVVESEELDRLVQRTKFEQSDAVKRFQTILRRSGVDDALRREGATNGDLIRVGDMEFEFVD